MPALRNSVLTSLRWTAAGRLMSQVLTWGITIYVIRLLSPGDYGLMGIASILVAFLMMMNELGLGAALVQKDDLSLYTRRQIFGLVLALNIVIFLLLFFTAPYLAAFYEDERLTAIIRVLSVQFLIMSYSVVPKSQLERNIDFRQLSIVDFIAAALSSVATLLLALAGFGVWSLVWASIITGLIKTIGYNVISPFRHLPVFSFAGVSQLFRFGGYVTLSRLLWFFYSQSDIMIAGKLLGKEIVGVYYVALHLATLPMQKISSIINQVSFPAYSRVQSDRKLVAGYLLKSVRLMSLFAFPALWGISAVAPELVLVLLDEKWAAAVLPLQLIGLLTPIRMINNLTAPCYFGLGRADLSFKNVVLLAIVMPLAFAFGCQWGVFGLCMAWLIVFPIATAINMHTALPVVGLGVLDVLKEAARALFAAAGMYLSVTLVRTAIQGSLPPVATLAILILVGAIAYGLLTLVINRATLSEFRDLAFG